MKTGTNQGYTASSTERHTSPTVVLGPPPPHQHVRYFHVSLLANISGGYYYYMCTMLFFAFSGRKQQSNTVDKVSVTNLRYLYKREPVGLVSR